MACHRNQRDHNQTANQDDFHNNDVIWRSISDGLVRSITREQLSGCFVGHDLILGSSRYGDLKRHANTFWVTPEWRRVGLCGAGPSAVDCNKGAPCSNPNARSWPPKPRRLDTIPYSPHCGPQRVLNGCIVRTCFLQAPPCHFPGRRQRQIMPGLELCTLCHLIQYKQDWNQHACARTHAHTHTPTHCPLHWITQNTNIQHVILHPKSPSIVLHLSTVPCLSREAQCTSAWKMS